MVNASATKRSINVTWMVLNCQDRHGIITMYEVRYTSSDFGDNVNQTLNTSMGDDTSLIVSGLEEFTNYTVEVRAYTSAGAGPYSTPMNVQTMQDSKHIIL